MMTQATTTCLTCEQIARRDRDDAALWDSIHRTEHWDLVHAYNTSLPGWLVLVARRHIGAIADLTAEEATELGILIWRTSTALHEITDCIKTYVMQFAEAEGHSHVHFHIVPRMESQPSDRRSIGIFGYLGVPDEERVGDEEMNKIAGQVRRLIIDSL